MRDLLNNIHPVPAIAPAAAVTDNTAFVSAWIDRQGYEAATFLLITGTDADADATFAVTMDHADATDQSDSAAVTEATDVVGTLALAGYTFANDGVCRKVGYIGGKRYCRLTVTPAANTGNAFLAAIALLGEAYVEPTPNPPQ